MVLGNIHGLFAAVLFHGVGESLAVILSVLQKALLLLFFVCKYINRNLGGLAFHGLSSLTPPCVLICS